MNPDDFDVLAYNRRAWNAQVAKANEWTVPVTKEVTDRARQDDWSVVLTPTRPVPRDWFPPLTGLDVLGLAASGGQQSSVFAAAGARVTVLDNSPGQLAQDRAVAERDGLELTLVEGDMADLSCFADQSFDLVFHPVSNCFVPDIRPVWREAHRVLRPGGVLLAGFINPIAFVFDHAASERGELVARHSIPYSDLTSIPPDERQAFIDTDEPLAFGHTLEDQLGGQLAAGLVLDGMYEDHWPETQKDPLSRYIATFVATRATRPA